MNKYLLSAFISFTITNICIADETQCVSVHIPKFNLEVDPECQVSQAKLVQSNLSDQVFLYNLGAPNTCFTIVDPISRSKNIEGTIHNPTTEEELDIIFSGVAGLTLNAYSVQSDPVSFTAASLVSIEINGEEFGKLVTRDAGTIFNFSDSFNAIANARLSVTQGTHGFKKVSGYFDEVGKEFNPIEPAIATGTLCGKDLVDSLFDEDD